MSLREKWDRGGKLKLLAAIAVNAVFLSLVLTFYYVSYETNDDVIMSLFASGFSENTAFMPFVNIALGWLIQMLYDVFGRQIPWFGILEYASVFLGLTALSWVLLKRLRLYPAFVAVGSILMCMGLDTYVHINFAKVAAIAGIGGLSAMLDAVDPEYIYIYIQDKQRRGQLIFGLLIAVLGFLWRPMEFFAAAALLSPLGFLGLAEIWRISKSKGFFKKAVHFVMPFLLLLGICIGAMAADKVIWDRHEPKFSSFSSVRGELMDYGGVPYYDLMEDEYKALGLSFESEELLRKWNFYDPYVFDEDMMRSIVEARDALPGQTLDLQASLKELFIHAPKRLIGSPPFVMLLMMLMLWAFAVKKTGTSKAASLITTGISLSILLLIYLCFIYIHRAYCNRVDLGLFLAVSVVLLFQLDDIGISKNFWRACAALVLSAAVLLGGWRHRGAICFVGGKDREQTFQEVLTAAEQLCADEEHLYLGKVWSINWFAFTPFYTPPENIMDKYVELGNWTVYHSSVEKTLNKYGVEDPYRDMVDNDKVLVIDDKPFLTTAHIRQYYYPEARMELEEEMSRRTGLPIYRVFSH